MKKFITGALTSATLLFSTALPAFALGASGTAGAGGTVGGLCPGGSYNTLCTNIPTAQGLVSTALNVLLFVAFVSALIFLIIGGIKWIMSGGDKEGTAKAKNTVTSALIGLVIVLAAWILINVILKFFGLNDISTLQLPSINGN